MLQCTQVKKPTPQLTIKRQCSATNVSHVPRIIGSSKARKGKLESFFIIHHVVFIVVAGVVGTVGNLNEFSERPRMGVGNTVGRVWAKRTLLCPHPAHSVVHAHSRKRPLNELGFPRFPQHALVIRMDEALLQTRQYGHLANEYGRIFPTLTGSVTRAVDGTSITKAGWCVQSPQHCAGHDVAATKRLVNAYPNAKIFREEYGEGQFFPVPAALM